MLEEEFIYFTKELEKERVTELVQKVRKETTEGKDYTNSPTYKKILSQFSGGPLKSLLLAWARLQNLELAYDRMSTPHSKPSELEDIMMAKTFWPNDYNEASNEVQKVLDGMSTVDENSNYYKLFSSTAFALQAINNLIALRIQRFDGTEISEENIKAVLYNITNAEKIYPENKIVHFARIHLFNFLYHAEATNPNKKMEYYKQLNEAIDNAILSNPTYEMPYMRLYYRMLYIDKNPAKAIETAKAALQETSNLFSARHHTIISLAHAELGNTKDCFEAAIKAEQAIKKNSRYTHPERPAEIQTIKSYAALAKVVQELENYHSNLGNTPPNKKQKGAKAKEIITAKQQLLLDKLTALTNIESKLNSALKDLLQNPNSENKDAVINLLHSEDATLGKSRGYSKIAKNIALAVALIGIGYVAAGLVNLVKTRGKHFAFFTPDSIQKVEGIERQVVDYYKSKKQK